MTARHAPLGSMFRWITGALRLLRIHPGPLFGASALMIGVVVALMVPGFALMGPLMMHPQQPDAGLAAIGAGRIGAFYGSMVLVNVLLMPPLVIGWMRLLRNLDLGQGGRALDLFAPYRDGAAWRRGIGYTLLALLVAVLLVGLFVAVLWTPLTSFIAQATASQAAVAAGLPPVPPTFPGALMLGYFVFLFVLGFFQLAYFIGFAELALRATPVSGSLGAGLAAVGRNGLRLLAWIICLFFIALGLALVAGLVLGLLMVGLAFIGPTAAMVGMVLIYIPMLLVTYPLMHAVPFLAWKDMLGDDGSASVDPSAPLAA